MERRYVKLPKRRNSPKPSSVDASLRVLTSFKAVKLSVRSKYTPEIPPHWKFANRENGLSRARKTHSPQCGSNGLPRDARGMRASAGSSLHVWGAQKDNGGDGGIRTLDKPL